MILTTLFKKVDVELHVIAMLAQAEEMSNAAHALLVCSFIRLRPKGSIGLKLYPDKHRLRRKSWGNGTLKGWCNPEAFKPRPCLRQKNVHFAILFI